MEWGPIKDYSAPLLDESETEKIPESFYKAFSVVFGVIDHPGDALNYLYHLNWLMEQKKGGGKLQREKIIKIREEVARSENESKTPFGVPEYDCHHVLPRSRDPRNEYFKDDQIVELPKKFHAAWHVLFANLYGDEIILFLTEVFTVLEFKSAGDEYKLKWMTNDLRKKRFYSRA